MRNEETLRQRKRRKMLYARGLRKRMTRAEAVLWEELRDRKCAGLKFRRQSPVEWFVADFLCVERSLIVEIDGGVHEEQREYDRARELLLRQKGLNILRFTNDQILRDLSSVLSAIQGTVALPPKKLCGVKWRTPPLRGGCAV